MFSGEDTEQVNSLGNLQWSLIPTIATCTLVFYFKLSPESKEARRKDVYFVVDPSCGCSSFCINK